MAQDFDGTGLTRDEYDCREAALERSEGCEYCNYTGRVPKDMGPSGEMRSCPECEHRR